MSLEKQIVQLAREAKSASLKLANVSTRRKNRVLLRMAASLQRQKRFLFRENAKDLRRAKARRLSPAMVDRLVPRRRDLARRRNSRATRSTMWRRKVQSSSSDRPG